MRWSRIPRILAVRHRGGFRLWLRFDDGVEGEFDLREVIGDRFDGVLAPLRDPSFVAQGFVHPEANTLAWPGGQIDLDPIVLHCVVTGTPIPGESKPRWSGAPAPRRPRPAKRGSPRLRSKKR